VKMTSIGRRDPLMTSIIIHWMTDQWRGEGNQRYWAYYPTQYCESMKPVTVSQWRRRGNYYCWRAIDDLWRWRWWPILTVKVFNAVVFWPVMTAINDPEIIGIGRIDVIWPVIMWKWPLSWPSGDQPMTVLYYYYYWEMTDNLINERNDWNDVKMTRKKK